MRLQAPGHQDTESSEWATDAVADRIPSAARLQLVRKRVVDNARHSKPRDLF